MRLLGWGTLFLTIEQFILDTVSKRPNIPEANIRMMCHLKKYDMYKVGQILDWLVREKKIYRYRIRNRNHHQFAGYILSMTKPTTHAMEFIIELVESWGAITQDQVLQMCDEIGYTLVTVLDVIDTLQKERKLFAHKVTNPRDSHNGRVAFTVVKWG